jgi:predicted phosphodiesterase
MTTINWLHFADLHCSQDDDYNINKMLEALWDDLRYLADDGLRPDFIVFTGDIAQSGKSDQYEMAEQIFFKPILAKTDLPSTRLFIVPGNHDVEWSKMDPIVTDGMARLVQDPERVNDFLSPERDRSLHLAQFESYADFINNCFTDHPTFSSRDFFYGHRFTVNDVAISLLGLNSAWMSATHRDMDNNVEDQGYLLIGERQLDRALEQSSQADLCIALMHHPSHWLHPSERSRTKRRLNAECNFVLHGHLHEPEVEIHQSLSGKSVSIPTGALYYSRDYPNGYNVGQFNTQTRRGTIYLRRYVDSGPEGRPCWVKDLASTGDNRDGQFQFHLLDVEPEPAVDDLENAQRILFVEDDEGWRNLMRRVLFPPQFDLQFASSAAEARNLLYEDKDFDLLILNLCLSSDRDYEGEILLRSLSQQHNSHKFDCIVLTGHMCPTKGLYDRYDVSEVFVKGDIDSFNRNRFLQTVRSVVGLL